MSTLDDKGRMQNKGVGQQYYVKTPETEFTQRVASWLDYLGISDLFPNIEDLSGKISEVGSKLREAGDVSFFGLSSGNEILIRPGDYATLLHLMTRSNNQFKGKLLSTEGGVHALEIFTVGDFDGVLESLLRSKFSSPRDKRLGRIISEASLALGRQIFDFLGKNPEKLYSEVNLIKLFGEAIDKYAEEFLKSQYTVEEYLVAYHRITEPVASYLLSRTNDDKKTILRSTSQTKKEVIGAFKSLVSFYHINLGYNLEDSIKKTEDHFKNDEALTIHKTLMYGSKDVFAKLEEYGYDLKISKALSEFMISHGASKSILYAKGFPKLLELTAQYGPKGKEFLGFTLANPNFFNILTLSNAADGLLNLSKIEPEQVGLILSELAQYDWNHEYKPSSNSSLDIDYVYTCFRETMINLSQEDKAKSAALALYVSSIPEDMASTLAEKFKISNNLSFTFQSLSKLFNNLPLNDLIEDLKEKYKKLPYSPKQIESKILSAL